MDEPIEPKNVTCAKCGRTATLVIPAHGTWSWQCCRGGAILGRAEPWDTAQFDGTQWLDAVDQTDLQIDRERIFRRFEGVTFQSNYEPMASRFFNCYDDPNVPYPPEDESGGD